MRLYLDTCFLNRPFDNQSVDRIRLETEALRIVLGHVDARRWTLIGSTVLDYEIARTADTRRREALEEILGRTVSERVELNEDTTDLARRVQAKGIAGLDALHLACAAAVGVDIFLTTDERLVRRAQRIADLVPVPVSLPLRWLESLEQKEGEQP